MTIRDIAPKVSGAKAKRQRAILAAIAPALDRTLAQYEIDTPARRAHFLAQIAHESDGFCTTEEYASGEAYEGRADLGNVHPGDGKRYKGRGLIQLTGRDNYARFGAMLGVDLLSAPELAADPVLSLKIACAFWELKGLNRFADADDLKAITRRINGGYNGLAARRSYLAKAKAAEEQKERLAFSPAPQPESWWARALAWFR